jgi:hypothetical protein
VQSGRKLAVLIQTPVSEVVDMQFAVKFLSCKGSSCGVQSCRKQPASCRKGDSKDSLNIEPASNSPCIFPEKDLCSLMSV